MMTPIKSGIKVIGYTDEFAGKIKVYNDMWLYLMV